ncbi:MAG: glutaredoxin [Lysinibacillus sp.]|nr:glutaredoxin [Lysinibacillus sp.]
MLLKFELNKLGLEGKYEEIFIDNNEEAKQKLLARGFLTVPVVEINGELMGDIESMKESISKMPL